MHDINSESGTKADIEKRNESYNAYVKNVTPNDFYYARQEGVWQNALRHSLLVAVYVLQDRLF